MKRIRLILETAFFFLAALSLCEACGKEKEPLADRFEVSPSTLTADAPGGQVAFNVISSKDWMAVVDQSWAKLLTVKGAGSEDPATVKISVSENPDAAQRTATVTVSTVGGNKKTVELIQAAGSGEPSVKGISSADDLLAFASAVNNGGAVSPYMVGGVVTLLNDIDASAIKEWIPVGTKSNPFIEAFDGKSVDYELITGVKCLSDGRVLFMNSQAPTQSLIERSKDGKFTSHHIPVLMKLSGNGYTNKSLGNLSDLQIDSNGNLWFVNNNWYISSLYRYNIDTKKILSFTEFKNQDGLSIENINYVSCTVEDKDGNIWVGTQQGPLLLEKGQITASNPVFTQVKVPRNDGTNYADYLLSGIGITAICIDGGGRKWFGTDNNGVYLISEDNLTQIQHFTTDNSKLLSNHVTSIAINNNTGEVFFGTGNGLCSYISDATTPVDEMTKDDVYAYPNPVEAGYKGLITIVGLSYDADVKILTSNGKLVAQGRSNGGTFTWNGCDQQGRRVASGVYMVATATSNGDKGVVCKIAIIN